MAKYICNAFIEKRCPGCDISIMQDHSVPHKYAGSVCSRGYSCAGNKQNIGIRGGVGCRPLTKQEDIALSI